MRDDLKGKAQGLGAKGVGGGQGGSLILEAIVVLGMIATFTPMLYKHVADRRADIENINRANTLLYLQHKAEDYLKDPDNVTALVEELGHNQHKEIYPSEMGAGSNFDGRYIVGIRREDEENKPVLKAMIIDTVHTGSDLRAAKVAELIGISAGIYTAVDPDAAWGINGIWSEPLSRYFDTTNIPTGAVAITTEYNKAKYRVNISDILVDADLDMGEFEVTAEQINAVAIAAKNGTLEQLIASNEVASPKLVSTGSICFRKDGEENCIESWEGLGGGEGQKTDLQLVQECSAGMTESCMQAFIKDLNTSCSKVDAVYDRFGAAYPNPKIYNLTYGSGAVYDGTVRTKCEGTQFVVDNISTSTLTNPVTIVGDTAFGITTPGWYQITLMGEAGIAGAAIGAGAGGILTANKQFTGDEILTLKGIKGGVYDLTNWGGAGVALWDTISTTGAPTLVAGGGRGSGSGGGIVGGSILYVSGFPLGYGWNGDLGGNTTICSDTTCGFTNAGGGGKVHSSNSIYGGSGSTQSECSASGYSNCITIMGGNSSNCSSPYVNYVDPQYGNSFENTLTGGKGYAYIAYCGSSESDCPATCTGDSDCSGATPVCKNALCTPIPCTIDSDCPDSEYPYCNNNVCSATKSCITDAGCPTAAPYCDNNICSATKSCFFDADCPSAVSYCVNGTCAATKSCSTDSDCSAGNKPYCVSSTCSNVLYSASIAGGYTTLCSTGTVATVATVTAMKGKYKFYLRGGGRANSPGGTWTATKTLPGSTSFQIRQICGGHASSGKYWGYSGVGLLEGSTIKLVAGGGGVWISGSSNRGGGGGGYNGGIARDANGNTGVAGYSWNGDAGSSIATSGAGTGGPMCDSGNNVCAYGGTGYCASDYSCTGTYATWVGGAYITITYCGDANSTCP